MELLTVGHFKNFGTKRTQDKTVTAVEPFLKYYLNSCFVIKKKKNLGRRAIFRLEEEALKKNQGVTGTMSM